MAYIALLFLGTAMFVVGLLLTTQSPFQYLWYCREADKRKLVRKDAQEYAQILFHLRIVGPERV
jgi:hypothetical protein